MSWWSEPERPIEPPDIEREECELCGYEFDKRYYDRNNDYIGCDECVCEEEADEVNYVCPVCGAECETIYTAGGEIYGCEHCVWSV